MKTYPIATGAILLTIDLPRSWQTGHGTGLMSQPRLTIIVHRKFAGISMGSLTSPLHSYVGLSFGGKGLMTFEAYVHCPPDGNLGITLLHNALSPQDSGEHNGARQMRASKTFWRVPSPESFARLRSLPRRPNTREASCRVRFENYRRIRIIKNGTHCW